MIKTVKKTFFIVLLLIVNLVSLSNALEINLSFQKVEGQPYFIGQPEMNIDAEEFDTVILKIKSSRSGTARLFWATNFDPQFNDPKSITFFIDRSESFKEYVFNVKAQNPNWLGFVSQLLVFLEEGTEGIEIEPGKAIVGNLITNIISGWREFFAYETPQLRTVNFIYGPKINGRSVNLYIYWLVILISTALIFYEFFINKKVNWARVFKSIVVVCLFFWIVLDLRILLDQLKTAVSDWHIFAGKSLEEKRAATTLGDFYNFLRFASTNLPLGSAFYLIHPSYYYYKEKANYYLYPTYFDDKNFAQVLVYDPNHTQEKEVNDFLNKGYKVVATFKSGEYILKK
uniref:Uncharacterized protein n=1 Tax=candidate division CPR3 bacterium TaxID=2268181 RepID=A0A7V3J954_UNCC3